MKKLLMIAAMAMFATVACSEDENPPVGPTPGAVEVTIVAAPTSVALNGTGAFTATLSKAAEADVTIAVTNVNPDFLTVAGAEIKIAKGATSANVAFTGKAKGTAKVTFVATGATLKTPELSVTVTETQEPPVGGDYEYPTAPWGTYAGMSKVVIGTTTLASTCLDGIDPDTGEVGPDKKLGGNDDFELGFVNDNKTATIVPLTDAIAYTIFVDNYTSTKDQGDVFFYIDWNNDKKFDEATELIVVKKGVSLGAESEITGTITIPATAAASSRARIIVANEDNDIENGIGSMDSGYMMDFMYSK